MQPINAMTPAEIRATDARLGAVAVDFSNLDERQAIAYIMGCMGMDQQTATEFYGIQSGQSAGDLIQVAK